MKPRLLHQGRLQQPLRWLDRLPLSVVIPAGIVLGCGVGGAGFYYLEAPGWAVAWLALFAALGWLGFTATPVFDEPDPVRTPTRPAKPRPVRDGSLLMVGLPGGCFLMGSPDSDDRAYGDEKPQHEVTVSPFRIAITPVTMELYRRIIPESSTAQSKAEARLPVTDVTWFDAVEFCNRLSKRMGYRPCYFKWFGWWRCDWRADGYRLPTEAEWEYACRAGTTTRFSFGDDPNGLDGHAWYADNANRDVQPVATQRTNPWGLYDLHGNIWEWCWDGYGSYSPKPTRDPCGPKRFFWWTERRILRGGSFVDSLENLRAARRIDVDPKRRFRLFGFRCVRVPPRQID